MQTPNYETLPGDVQVIEKIELPTHGAPEGVSFNPEFSEVREMVTNSRPLKRPNRTRPIERD